MAGPMAASHHVQSMVDSLANDLERSVVINDQAVRLICASRHFGDEDEVRIRAVLQRNAGADVVQFVLAQGVARWHEPHFIEGDSSLSLKARLCVPLHGPGWLLGMLMVIDADHTLTATEITHIEAASREIAGQLYSDFLGHDPTYLERQTALRELLGADAGGRHAALGYFDEHGTLPGADHIAVTVVTVSAQAQSDIPVDTALRLVIETVTQTRSRSWEMAVDYDRALLLQLKYEPFDRRVLREQGARIVAELCRLLGVSDRCAVGVATNSLGREQAWLARRHAEIAVRSAARRSFGDVAVAFWDDLGVDGVLLQLPNDALVRSNLPEQVQALAENDGASKLVDTARSFLDHGGSISRTAAALHMHRTSLYYRLDQIKSITGLDLDDGRDRLLLHLGLHLLDLTEPTG